MAQRIKGQEVSIIVVAGGSTVDTLTDIMNFNMEVSLEMLEQGYIGETTNRYDEIFNGAKFDFEMHQSSQDFLTFEKQVEARARRDQPDLEFNIVVTLNFPNGETPIVTLPDVSFGAIPFNVGSRKDYAKVKIQGACSELDVQQS